MPTYYYPSNVTSFFGMIQYVNDISEGWFGGLLLATLFFITFIAMKNYPTERALAVACFVTLLSSFFLWMLQMIAQTWFILIAIACGLALLFLEWRTHTD
jgi:hypothetical protein